MKQEHPEYACGDRCIGQVEYRPKEKTTPAPERKPGGPGAADDREIEHIYHFPCKNGA